MPKLTGRAFSDRHVASASSSPIKKSNSKARSKPLVSVAEMGEERMVLNDF